KFLSETYARTSIRLRVPEAPSHRYLTTDGEAFLAKKSGNELSASEGRPKKAHATRRRKSGGQPCLVTCCQSFRRTRAAKDRRVGRLVEPLHPPSVRKAAPAPQHHNCGPRDELTATGLQEPRHHVLFRHPAKRDAAWGSASSYALNHD